METEKFNQIGVFKEVRQKYKMPKVGVIDIYSKAVLCQSQDPYSTRDNWERGEDI